MIDTHAHLNFKAFEDDYEEVIRRAQEAGVEAMINVGSNLQTSEKAVELAKKFECCWAVVGVHPIHWEEISELRNWDIRRKLKELAKNKKVVAIGETGLDYYQIKNSKLKIKNCNSKFKVEEIKKLQKELFKLHLELARELKLPLIIHNREAHNDILDIMLRVACYVSPLKGVFHCFSGSQKFLKKVLRMGFDVGFDGNITYKTAADLRELVKATPLPCLLLETDCPYLTPEPIRNQRNEPKNVKIIGEMIANLKNLDFNKIKRTTTENAKNLFKI